MNIFATLFSAVLNASLGLLALVVFTTEARLPPKFVKAANGAGKALYATRYGYSTIPLPAQISLHTNLARKEVHFGGGGARNRKPTVRRPRHHPEYASKYQDYNPKNRPPKKKPRNPRPPKRRPNNHRPPYKEPEYYDQEDIEEDTDETDYEYDDRTWTYRDNKEYEDFLGQHSKLHGNAYYNNRGKRGRKRVEEEGAFSEHSAPVYVRKPKPYTNTWSGTSRPTNKLYSSTVGLATRPSFVREEERHLYEEDNEERRPRNKDKPKRNRAKEESRFRDQEQEVRHRDNDRYRYDNYRNWQHSGSNGQRDRQFENKQKRRERVINSAKNNSKDKRDPKHRDREWTKNEKDIIGSEWDEENDEKLRRPSRENQWKSRENEKWKSEHQDTEFKGNTFQNKQGEKWKNEESFQQMKRPIEDSDQNERWKIQEKDKNRNVKQEVTETQIPPQIWTTQLPTQLPNWREPQFHVIPSITPILLSSELPITWNTNLQNQQNWNNFNQNNLQGRWLEDPMKWNTQNTEHLSRDINNDDRWRTKVATKINKKEDNRIVDRPKENNDVVTVAQRVVQTTLGWKPENIREGEISDLQKWNTQEKSPPSTPQLQFLPSDLNSQPQWPQTNTQSHGAHLNAGEIVYGSRFKDENQKRKEPDIGFGQGMEVFDNTGGWQVY